MQTGQFSTRANNVGLAMYESDCNSNQLRQDARVLQEGFVGRETIVGDKNPYCRYDRTPCTSQFSSKTSYSFGGMEQREGSSIFFSSLTRSKS